MTGAPRITDPNIRAAGLLTLACTTGRSKEATKPTLYTPNALLCQGQCSHRLNSVNRLGNLWRCRAVGGVQVAIPLSAVAEANLEKSRRAPTFCRQNIGNFCVDNAFKVVLGSVIPTVRGYFMCWGTVRCTAQMTQPQGW